MPNVFKVSTKFGSDDRELGRSYRRMGRFSDQFGDRSSRAFGKASRAANNFGGILKGFLAANLISKGLGQLTAGVSEVTSQFISFDDVTTAAATRFKDIGPDAANFAERLQAIKDVAREAGATTEYTATQSGQALDFLARAGWKSEEAFKGLRSMIDLATATGEDFARVADISSDLLGAFGLNADNTTDKIRNLNRLNDVLVKTANSANVTVESMFETMKTIGPIATGVLGASVEDVAALTGILGNSGIKGTEAMTALKNAFLNLAAPVGDGAKALKYLRISMKDLVTGEPRKLEDILGEIGEKIKGLDKIKQAGILDAIFGKRAIAGSKNLADNVTQVKQLKEELMNAGGISERTAERMRQSLGNRIKTLISASVELGFKFLDIFGGKANTAILNLTELIGKIDIKSVIETLGKGAKFVNDIGSAIYEAGQRTGFFDEVKKSVPIVVKHFETMWDIVRTLFNFLNDAGLFDAILFSLKTVLQVIEGVLSGLQFIWGVVKPIIETLGGGLKRYGESSQQLAPLQAPNLAQVQYLGGAAQINIDQSITAPDGTKTQTNVKQTGPDRRKMGFNLSTATYGYP